MNDIKLRVAFLGGLFPDERMDEILNKTIGLPQNAADKLQKSIIAGIERILDKPITIINSLFIGSFPKHYKSIYIPNYLFNHSTYRQHQDFNIGFINLPIIKHLSRIIRVNTFLRNNAKLEQYDLIVGYSMTLTIVKGLLKAKQIYPNVITCLVVPDLPEFMNLGKKSVLFNLAKNVSNHMLYNSIRKVDCFVVLTEYMAEALGIKDKPYSVIEGMIEPKDLSCIYDSSIKRIVYTGSLGEKYGIKDLVDAFHRLDDDDIQLLICGGGDTVDYIREMADIDNRIIYKGVLTPQEIESVQQNAYIFINPRNGKEEYTRYSFPSKTLEYLAAGHPVLMYKLPGVPNEYDDYLLYFDDNQDDSIYLGLKKVIAMNPSEIESMGIKGKQFVELNKTSYIQSRKIVDMYNSF